MAHVVPTTGSDSTLVSMATSVFDVPTAEASGCPHYTVVQTLFFGNNPNVALIGPVGGGCGYNFRSAGLATFPVRGHPGYVLNLDRSDVPGITYVVYGESGWFTADAVTIWHDASSGHLAPCTYVQLLRDHHREKGIPERVEPLGFSC